jgi:hypothetical protein
MILSSHITHEYTAFYFQKFTCLQYPVHTSLHLTKLDNFHIHLLDFSETAQLLQTYFFLLKGDFQEWFYHLIHAAQSQKYLLDILICVLSTIN